MHASAPCSPSRMASRVLVDEVQTQSVRQHQYIVHLRTTPYDSPLIRVLPRAAACFRRRRVQRRFSRVLFLRSTCLDDMAKRYAPPWESGLRAHVDVFWIWSTVRARCLSFILGCTIGVFSLLPHLIT